MKTVKEKYEAWLDKKEQEEKAIQAGDVVTAGKEEYIVLEQATEEGLIRALRMSDNKSAILYMTEKTGRHYDLPWLREKERDEHGEREKGDN